MKNTFLILTIILFAFPAFSQTKEYSFCDCKEAISKSGDYTLTCNNIQVEEGRYKDENRTGLWTSRNIEGQVIIKANYKNDYLDGSYEQFHFKGVPKIKAQFSNGQPVGNWIYYNEKGRVIKEGQFDNGKPTGVWKIYNKKGKKLVVDYDFDNQKPINWGQAERYFDKGGTARDDQSGEWMVLHFPNRNISTKIEPVGGFLLAGDLFLDYLNIPYVFVNTYTHYEFIAKLEISDGNIQVNEVLERNKGERFDPTKPSFPFIVQTNSPSKLTRTEHSQMSIKLLKNRIKDIVAISGPWTVKEYSGPIEIQIPFVVNDLKK